MVARGDIALEIDSNSSELDLASVETEVKYEGYLSRKLHGLPVRVVRSVEGFRWSFRLPVSQGYRARRFSVYRRCAQRRLDRPLESLASRRRRLRC
jgi:hypothetical protein